MKVFEHRDFEQVVLQAAEYFRGQGLRPALIEKDYYVTEALRIIAATVGDKVIFKGGTSLSKGWNLIQRFSEDIDIFLDPRAFEPVLAKRGIDLSQLAVQADVTAMLRSDEYAAIKADYDEISRAHFARSYFAPQDMSFATSDALFPAGELAASLGREYETQCRQLCLGPYPAWTDVQARFLELKELL